MNHREVKLLVVFCTASLLFSGLISAGSVLVNSECDEQIVRIDVRKAKEVGTLNELGLDIIDRSGRYALVETDEDTIENLRDKGIRVNTLPGRTKIYVKGHSFDIDEGPDLDPTLTIDEYPEGSTGTYIVHLLGPVNPRWREQLESMGVEILNYVPNYAYEVRMTPEMRDRVESLDFVDWTGIYHPGFRIDEDIEPGRIHVTLVPDADLEAFDRSLDDLQVRNSERVFINTASGWRTDLLVDDLTSIQEMAKEPDVYYISRYHEPQLLSEVDSQIIGGGAWIMDDEDDDPDTAYRRHGDHGAYINQIGYTGEGVTVAVADTGLGDGTEGDAGHPDFEGRVVGGFSYEGHDEWQDGHSHGTHCTGSVAGNTYAGTGTRYAGLDGEYYASQGLAYDSEIFAMKIFTDDGQFMPDDYFDIVQRPLRESDSYIHSNSWGADTGGEYTESDEAYDEAVRDAHRIVPQNLPMVITVAAGNSGPGDQSIGSPANAKNVISVGATETYMPDAGNYGGSGGSNPDNVVDFSSRGWTQDGRVKPDVVAPGASVLSTMTPEDTGNGGGRGGYSPTENEPQEFGGGYTEDGRYEWMSGTSMSNPAVAGAAAVVVQWYEENHGETPSPAMVRSLLINTAHDLDDANGNTGPIPNQDEGWGMVDISKLEYPKDDPVPIRVYDQPTQLQTGEVDEYQVMTGSDEEPLKMSLVWTDKHAQSGDDPTLKNDLNLEVESPTGAIYRGNAFSGGWTQAGQDAMDPFDSNGDGYDNVNNVENVYIHPDEVEDGVYNISVEGFNVPADANNDGNASQDYALVVYNAPVGPDVEINSPEYGDVIRRSEVTVEWISERSENHEVRLNQEEWIDVGMNTSYTFEDVEDWDNHKVEVRATDFLGDNSTESVTFSVWTVDVDIRSPEEDDIISEKTVTVDWRSDHAEYHEIRLNQGAWIDVGRNTSHTLEDLEDGDHGVEVRATDVAEYQSVCGVNFTIDTAPPEIEIISPEHGFVSPERSVTIEWEGKDEFSGIDRYEMMINQGSWQNIGLDTSYRYDDLDDGHHEVQVRVTDRAGNQETDGVNFTVDTLDPIVSVSDPEDGDMINSDSITVTWGAWDDISGINELEIGLDEGADGNWNDRIELSSEQSEQQYTFEDLPEGEHVVEVRAIDFAGNEENVTISFTVDTIPPDLWITSPSEDGAELRTDFVTVEWECEERGTDIESYEIRLDGGEWNTVEETTYTFDDLEDGSYRVEVRATDQAGNNETAAVSFEVSQSIFHIYWAQYWWLILPIVLIISIAVIVKLVKRRKKDPDDEEAAPSGGPVSAYPSKGASDMRTDPEESRTSAYTGTASSYGTSSATSSRPSTGKGSSGKACPTCGMQLRWFGSSQKWYCENCQQYKVSAEDEAATRRETPHPVGTSSASNERKDVERHAEPPKEKFENEEEEERCPLCGIKVDPGSKECWACGNDLTEDE